MCFPPALQIGRRTIRAAVRLVGTVPRGASLLFLLSIAGAPACSHAQAHPSVCSEGTGSFAATYATGVSVDVGAARRDGLATRLCQAALHWEKRTLAVASGAMIVDVDAFGIDIGFGTPVVTFEVKQAKDDCCSAFLVYSLQKPPKLLRTITGGEFFRSADVSLNGQIAVWVNDAVALTNFDTPNMRRPEFGPTVALRIMHGRLLDAGAEYQDYFDQQIAAARGSLTAASLEDFKTTDGLLASTTYFSPEEQHRAEQLQRTKIAVLRIVWSYLYSGREQKAWSTLAELWPARDVDRIRGEIERARASGILTQLAGAAPHARRAPGTVKVYDLRKETQPEPEFMGRRHIPAPTNAPILPPQPIMLDRLVPLGVTEADLPDTEVLELVVDSAGKVRSVEPAELGDPNFTPSLKSDALNWKFVPALNQGQPVASRIFLLITPKR